MGKDLNMLCLFCFETSSWLQVLSASDTVGMEATQIWIRRRFASLRSSIASLSLVCLAWICLKGIFFVDSL